MIKQHISLPSHNFGVADFETTPIKEEVQKFLCGGIYDYSTFRYYESIEEIINYFIKAEHKIFYFHNLSYDYRFLLHYLLDNFDIDIIPRNSQILKIDVYNKDKKLFELRDSYALMPLSLKKISESFCNKYKKQDFDIMDIEKIFKNNKEKVIEYLKLDCLSLYEALDNYMKILKIDKNKALNLTLPCITMQNWKRYYKDHKNIICHKNYDREFRYGYFGARTEVFNMKCDEGYYYDFNSLYPSVMLENEFPIGKLEKLTNDMQFFYAHITIEIPKTFIPPLPFKTNYKLYFPIGKWSGWYNSVDIKLCQELGFKVKINKGYGWNESDMIFYDYISECYNDKQKAEKENNKGLYEISKLRMNSLYGKFGEKKDRSIITTLNYDELKENMKEYTINSVDKKYNLFQIQKENDPKFTTTHISSFVTSLARKKLYDLLISIYPNNNIYYCDTDSIITDKLLKTSNKIGELKLEHEVKNGYFALPKLYTFRNQKGELIIKCKGLDYNKLTYKQIKDFVESHKTIKNKSIRLSTLKKILKGDLDFTECYELEREVKYKPDIFKRKIVNNYNTEPYNVKEIRK